MNIKTLQYDPSFSSNPNATNVAPSLFTIFKATKFPRSYENFSHDLVILVVLVDVLLYLKAQ